MPKCILLSVTPTKEFHNPTTDEDTHGLSLVFSLALSNALDGANMSATQVVYKLRVFFPTNEILNSQEAALNKAVKTGLKFDIMRYNVPVAPYNLVDAETNEIRCRRDGTPIVLNYIGVPCISKLVKDDDGNIVEEPSDPLRAISIAHQSREWRLAEGFICDAEETEDDEEAEIDKASHADEVVDKLPPVSPINSQRNNGPQRPPNRPQGKGNRQPF